jgi:hypothetical protein
MIGFPAGQLSYLFDRVGCVWEKTSHFWIGLCLKRAAGVSPISSGMLPTARGHFSGVTSCVSVGFTWRRDTLPHHCLFSPTAADVITSAIHFATQYP